MRTGFDLTTDHDAECEAAMLETKLASMMMLLLEQSIRKSCEYMRAAGRNTLTPGDVRAGMIYECHEFMDRDSLEDDFFEILQRDESSDDDDDIEEVDGDTCNPFSFAPDSAGVTIATMNRYMREWDSWVPRDELQIKLKEAIDNSTAEK